MFTKSLEVLAYLLLVVCVALLCAGIQIIIGVYGLFVHPTPASVAKARLMAICHSL